MMIWCVFCVWFDGFDYIIVICLLQCLSFRFSCVCWFLSDYVTFFLQASHSLLSLSLALLGRFLHFDFGIVYCFLDLVIYGSCGWHLFWIVCMKAKLSSERDAMSATIKKLSRDLAKVVLNLYLICFRSKLNVFFLNVFLINLVWKKKRKEKDRLFNPVYATFVNWYHLQPVLMILLFDYFLLVTQSLMIIRRCSITCFGGF